MKSQNLLNLFLVALFLCFTNLSKAQSEIYGTWTVGCAIEKYNISSMGFCGLCPRDSKSENALTISGFDLVINETNIVINDSPRVPYLWNNEVNSIIFKFGNKEYAFKVMATNLKDIIVWKEINSGDILVLQKK